jgi:adenosyl cobinamide kinase/adenosyl cobinamide phosphate guanylyltransferase
MSYTFITGGASSGKSGFAVNMFGDRKDVTFIATGLRTDTEMEQRISAHRAQRPPSWKTIEEPLDLISALKRADPAHEVVLIDCLTMWISNLLHMEKHSAQEVIGEAEKVVSFLKSLEKTVVVVSNELGMGVIPPSAVGREFRKIAGEVNQLFARDSEAAYLVLSGLGLRLR